MKYLILALVLGSIVTVADSISHEAIVTIEVTDESKVCAKAINVLSQAKNIEDPAAFVSIDGKPNVGKCLESIFSELSSPTNGYRVISVERNTL